MNNNEKEIDIGAEIQDRALSTSILETRNVFKKSNICIMVYMLLNLLLIWGVLSFFKFSWQVLLISIAVYAFSLLIALSPIGEFFLRWQTGCKKIKRDDHKQLLMPLFEEVYAKSKALMPDLPDGIKIYLNSDNAPNAFATGRRTICATRGLLRLPPEQIKAILAHEFGHIAHRDTYLLQGVIVGNIIVIILVTILKIASLLFTGIASVMAASERGIGRGVAIFFTFLAHVAVVLGFNIFMWLWTKLGVLLCMKTSRENEYEADRFSSNCGFNSELIDAFETLAADSESPKGIFATLSSSHPDFDERIAILQSYQKKEVMS